MSETFPEQVELARADAARFREIPRTDCVAATREYILGRRKEIRAHPPTAESDTPRSRRAAKGAKARSVTDKRLTYCQYMAHLLAINGHFIGNKLVFY